MDERERKARIAECRRTHPNLCRVVDELMKSGNPKRMAARLCLFLEGCPEDLVEGRRENEAF